MIFRIRDVYSNCWVSEPSKSFFGNTNDIFISPFSGEILKVGDCPFRTMNGFKSIDEGRYIAQQAVYVGSNGEPVFDGDIIEVTVRVTDMYLGDEDEYDTHKGVVIWCPEYCAWKFRSFHNKEIFQFGKSDSDCWADPSTIKILGNIFDNPDFEKEL